MVAVVVDVVVHCRHSTWQDMRYAAAKSGVTAVASSHCDMSVQPSGSTAPLQYGPVDVVDEVIVVVVTVCVVVGGHTPPPSTASTTALHERSFSSFTIPTGSVANLDNNSLLTLQPIPKAHRVVSGP